jgi:prepilin-type processing-associated H-X9-DG protein
LGAPGPNNPDNTNTLYLSRGLLGPYNKALGDWHCPADQSTSTEWGVRYPHVRSLAMNFWIGSYDASTAADSPEDASAWGGSTHKIVCRFTDMVNPAPVNTFVLLDERDDSINDCVLVTDMAACDMVDYPSNYHNNAGGFNFADGHAEIHKWRDARTFPPHQVDVHLENNGAGTPMPDNQDIFWLQSHAAGPK